MKYILWAAVIIMMACGLVQARHGYSYYGPLYDNGPIYWPGPVYHEGPIYPNGPVYNWRSEPYAPYYQYGTSYYLQGGGKVGAQLDNQSDNRGDINARLHSDWQHRWDMNNMDRFDY